MTTDNTPRLIVSLHTGHPGGNLAKNEADYSGYRRLAWEFDAIEAVKSNEIKTVVPQTFHPVAGPPAKYMVIGIEWRGRYVPLAFAELEHYATSGETVHADPSLRFASNVLSAMFQLLGIDADRIAAETAAI